MGFNKISSKIYHDKCPLKTQEKNLKHPNFMHQEKERN